MHLKPSTSSRLRKLDPDRVITWAQFGPAKNQASLVYLTSDEKLFYRERVDRFDLDSPKLLYNGSSVIPSKVFFGMTIAST